MAQADLADLEVGDVAQPLGVPSMGRVGEGDGSGIDGIGEVREKLYPAMGISIRAAWQRLDAT
jgi:hypothetical protein